MIYYCSNINRVPPLVKRWYDSLDNKEQPRVTNPNSKMNAIELATPPKELEQFIRQHRSRAGSNPSPWALDETQLEFGEPPFDALQRLSRLLTIRVKWRYNPSIDLLMGGNRKSPVEKGATTTAAPVGESYDEGFEGGDMIGLQLVIQQPEPDNDDASSEEDPFAEMEQEDKLKSSQPTTSSGSSDGGAAGNGFNDDDDDDEDDDGFQQTQSTMPPAATTDTTKPPSASKQAGDIKDDPSFFDDWDEE